MNDLETGDKPAGSQVPSLGLHATDGRAETCALEIRKNEDGTLDEIVGTGRFHLEQMDTGHWWMLFEDAAGKAVHVHLQARGKIKASFEEECR